MTGLEAIRRMRELTDAMPERCQAMVVLQAGLGVRVGELLGLTVEDVDFLRRVVQVRKQLTRDGKVRVQCKTPRSRRDLPLP
jgi:integrase